jgi:hypothetical protein
MDKPSGATAYVLLFAGLGCWQCAKDPTAPEPCNDLVADAPAHDYVYVAGPLPAATGGTIEDGLYYENAAEVFDPTRASGPSDLQRSVTTLIAGQIWQTAYQGTSPSGTEPGTETYLISPAAPGAGEGQLVMTRTCPADRSMTTPFRYSFSGSGPGATLQLIFDGPPPLVYTTTRQ